MLPCLILGHSGDAQILSLLPAEAEGSARHHGRAASARKQRCQKSDDAAPEDKDRTARNAFAELSDVRTEYFRVRMQDAIGCDRTHLRNENTEDRINTRRQRDQKFMERISGMTGLVAIGRQTMSPKAKLWKWLSLTRATSI